MRIGINTRFLLKDKLEGIGVYTQEVSKRLVKILPEHEWFFFFDRKYDESFIPNEQIQPILTYPPARHPLLWYWWFEKSLPQKFKKHQIDLFFSPDGYLSLSTNIPQLLTIHDIAFEYYPQSIPWLVNQYYRHYTPQFCQKAQHIFTISQQTKSDLVNNYTIAPNKISVSPNGVSEIFQPLSETEKSIIQNQYTQALPYFLYVGAIHPRKNVISIFQSFEKFKDNYPNSPHQLVIVGRKAWSNSELMQFFDQMKYQKEVIWLENIPRKQLIQIMGAATALIYLSLYEGFGLPIIESMACGVTCITSQNSPMSEILQDGGLTVNPLDIDEVSNAMNKLASKPSYLHTLNIKCLEISRNYTWDKSAMSIAEKIEQISISQRNR
ncbi:MAG: glycosyltransferase family 4 protein [Chitinophagales bacterium]|nr:glycosyltransferase family 4 protein [Chitinophagales bacterium]